MILIRWMCLGVFVCGLTGGCTPPDPATDPPAAATRKERADKIEQYKAKAAQRTKGKR